MSRMVWLSPIGTSGLGSAVVYGRSRTPLPPARITACIKDAPSSAVADLAEPSTQRVQVEQDQQDGAGQEREVVRQRGHREEPGRDVQRQAQPERAAQPAVAVHVGQQETQEVRAA